MPGLQQLLRKVSSGTKAEMQPIISSSGEQGAAGDSRRQSRGSPPDAGFLAVLWGRLCACGSLQVRSQFTLMMWRD